MRNPGRHLLLLTLSGVLLVNLGLNANGELAKQDSLLPDLVSDVAESSPSSDAPQLNASDTTTRSQAPAASNPISADDSQEDKNKDNQANQGAQQSSGKDEGQQNKHNSSQQEASQSVGVLAAQADNNVAGSSQRKAEGEPESSGSEKDIRTLLANKNDSENDLTSPNIDQDKFSSSGSPLIVVTSTDKKEPAEMDSPVDIGHSEPGKAPAEAYGGRFHYSLAGNSDKPLQESVDQLATTTKQPAVPEEPSKKETEGVSAGSEKQAELAPKKDEPSSSEADPPSKEPTSPSKGASPDTLAGKTAEIDDKTKPVVVEPIGVNKPDSSVERLAPADGGEQPASMKTTTTTTTTTTAAPPTTTTTSATTTTTTQSPDSSTSPAQASSTERASAGPQSEDKPKEDAPKEPELASEKAKPQVKAEDKITISEAKNSTLVAKEAPPKKPTIESADSKPASVPSILAVALGTALGSAVNPLFKSQNKDKVPPMFAPGNGGKNSTTSISTSTSASTSTRAPSSTTRKSATDKWDRWFPSTAPSFSATSGAPPTRLRPILPSIRRRFRPYNRFNSFPIGGLDSYSPGESGAFAPAEPAGFGQASSRKPATYGASSPPPTSRPSLRRRASSTEPPKLAGSGPSSDESVSDEEVSLGPQEASSRRRGQGANRRRHHHHHHHHAHDRNGEPEVGARRHYHNQQHGTRHYEREEPLGGGAENPAFNPEDHHHRRPARPSSPGFSLFNASPAGSGFDLLNPFSSWLDETIKPRPPVAAHQPHHNPSTIGSPGRRPGSQPIPVEGDYNDEPVGHHQRPTHNNRDDYHHDHHHHDCDHHHEHDYDRDRDHDHHHDHHHRDRDREPYRPSRPHREPLRPPIGGDYDPYQTSLGRRPARPYNRRDQTEPASSGEQAANSGDQAAPGLYSGGFITPVAPPPRRVPSIFSPFDSLFGSLDDDLFSLRSSFVDVAAGQQPLSPKAQHETAFDTILSSPKISMPSAGAVEAASAGKEVDEKPMISRRSESSSSSSSSSAIKPIGEQQLQDTTVNNGKRLASEDAVNQRAQRAVNYNNNNDCSDFFKLGSVVKPKH